MLKKVLEIEDRANIPACSFTFTATAGSAVDATSSTLAVLAGVDPDKITYKTVADNSDHLAFATAGSAAITATTVTTAGNESSAIPVAYAANDVTLGSSNAASGSTITVTNDNVVLSDGNAATYYAEKEVELDFSDCGFTEPGVYRYLITESTTSENVNTGIINDTDTTRTLDVYVEDASYYTRSGEEGSYTYTYNKKLKIAGYVMYVGTQTTGPSNSNTAISGTAATMEDNTTKTSNGLEVASATKSVGFKNTYVTHDLTFSKTVDGNQASRDKFFMFKVEIKNATAGNLFDVDIAEAESAVPETVNAATQARYASQKNAAQLVADTTKKVADDGYTFALNSGSTTEGTITAYYYLQHGNTVTIKGLSDKTSYTITEYQEDYEPEFVLTGDTKNGDEDAGTNITSLTVDTTDSTVESWTAKYADTALTKDTNAAFKNTRQGTIPTGILLSVAAPAGVGVVVISGIAYLVIKNKRSKS